jgi:hypothetical protein
VPGLSLYRELDELAESVRPETRFDDLAIWFRRLTVVAPVPVADNTELLSEDGIRIRVRNSPKGLICASVPPGRSRVLGDGAILRGPGFDAVLRVEVVAKFGGRWDYLNACWSDCEPDYPLLLDLQESQIELVRWFANFWRLFKSRSPEDRARAAMVWSDRRAGKTWACFLLVVAATLDCPMLDGQELVVWAVSVSYKERKELDRYLRETLPRTWYRIRLLPDPCIELCNGGVIWHISADNEETLKQGRADLVFFNEAAKMDSRPFENAGPGTADRGGLVLLATNPPNMNNPRGYWVQELHEQFDEAQSIGDPLPMVWIPTSSKWNVAIDANARKDWGRLLRAVNPDQARADDEGLLLPRGDFAYRPPFSAHRHASKSFVPEEWADKDITRAVTASRTGQAYDWILGADFQHWPAMVAVAMKIFGDPDNPTVWALGEFWLPRSDEDKLIDAVEDDMEWVHGLPDDALRPPRFTPENAMFVGDSTGSFQNGTHTPGKNSFAVFSSRAWRIMPVIPPRAPGKNPPNPPVPLSVARVHKLLEADRLFIAPWCPKLIVSLKHCRTKRGKGGLFPDGDEAHLTDALRYAIWWILPQRRRPSPLQRAAQRLPERPAPRKYTRL